MTVRRQLVVKGRGPDFSVTFYVEVHRGKVWLTCFDRPFVVEAILDTAQAESLRDLLRRAAEEAGGSRKGAAP